MKLLDIALKDMWRSVRNAFFLVFGLVLPLGIGALFFFAFGGMASDDGGLELATIQVQVANLDEAQLGFSGGELVADLLKTAIPELIEATEVQDPAAARAAVDEQRAAVAVIIPQGFTAALFAPDGRANVQVYQDPTLMLGPSIVKGLVSQLVDGFAGSKIAAGVAQETLLEQGLSADSAAVQGIAMQYADWSGELGELMQSGEYRMVETLDPATDGAAGNEGVTMVLGTIMAGMMVFFVFFTGAASAQSILQEEEEGTLPRLFTTPTAVSTILGGKVLAIFALLAIQVVVLVLAVALIFSIDWGPPGAVALVILGLVVLASSFGIFITSLLKDTRQSGIVFGGVMTVMGMIGMVSVFTVGVPDTSGGIGAAALLVPQGWGVRGWQLLLDGRPVQDILATVAVMIGLGIVFFAIGVLRFRKRFA